MTEIKNGLTIWSEDFQRAVCAPALPPARTGNMQVGGLRKALSNKK
jgi:hypothetical protein